MAMQIIPVVGIHHRKRRTPVPAAVGPALFFAAAVPVFCLQYVVVLIRLISGGYVGHVYFLSNLTLRGSARRSTLSLLNHNYE